MKREPEGSTVVARPWPATTAGRRSLRLKALVLVLAGVMVAPVAAAAGEDELRPLLGALSMEVPVRSMAAPPFALPALNGTTVRLEELQGRVVMLYFWTTW